MLKTHFGTTQTLLETLEKRIPTDSPASIEMVNRSKEPNGRFIGPYSRTNSSVVLEAWQDHRSTSRTRCCRQGSHRQDCNRASQTSNSQTLFFVNMLNESGKAGSMFTHTVAKIITHTTALPSTSSLSCLSEK
ncbi:unnamed protein product [Macrosiphum euphorbiae]|uniref:Uncharacterized protein n=1 Tax=Macrosiphum euphorbiae TaxID=13131 RepID=A0AAV0XSE3_9HEMI|nr:unnamed protein product [Macrosiphum euphorbiae]